jgi:hypothetical protein
MAKTVDQAVADGDPCWWCHGGPSVTLVYATPTCSPCVAGGRTARIKGWSQSMARAAKEKD